MNYNSYHETKQYGYINGVLLSLQPIEFATDTLAQTLSSYTALIKIMGNTRVLPFKKAFKTEFTADETIYDTGDERQVKVRTKGAFNKWHWEDVDDLYKPFFKQLDGKDVYVLWLTSNGYIRGLKDVATGLKMVAEKVRLTITLTEATATTEEYTTISLQRSEPEDRLTYGKTLLPNFDLDELKQLVPVTLAQVGTASANLATFSVLTPIGTAFTGLAKTDFKLNGSALGVGVTFTDLGTGSYTLAGTSILTDNDVLSLVNPASITDADLYCEATGTLTLDIT